MEPRDNALRYLCSDHIYAAFKYGFINLSEGGWIIIITTVSQELKHQAN